MKESAMVIIGYYNVEKYFSFTDDNGSPGFAAACPAAIWRGERGPHLGVRARVRTLAPPNAGIYHGNSQRAWIT